MPYFLDGNNLIGSARRTSRPGDEDQSALVAEIADRLRRTKARAVLFFDGAGARNSTLGPLTVRSPQKESADDAIVAEVGRSRAPREIVVVTADRDLSRRVRDLGAKTLTPGEFWSRVGFSAPPGDQKGEATVDVEDWLRYFEEGKKP